MATVPFGLSTIALSENIGIMIMIIAGAIRLWASRSSEQAEPSAPKSEPYISKAKTIINMNQM